MRTRINAFTLLEVMVALTIFMSVLIMVTQATIGTNQQFSLGEAEDRLFLENEQILTTIRNDLISSGWEIPSDQLEGSGQLSTAAAVDRTKRYFPYAMIQAPNGEPQADPLGAGLGTAFRHAWRDPALVRIPLPAILQPGTAADFDTAFGSANRAAWDASWHARSQELVFLKVNLGDWSAAPWNGTSTTNANVAFNGPLADWMTGNHNGAPGNEQDSLGILHPCGWTEVGTDTGIFSPIEDADLDGLPDEPYGVPLDSAILDPATLELQPNWDTMNAPDFGWRGSPPAYVGPDPAAYREYMYCVVPSTLGLGRLVRAVKVADATGFAVGTDPGQRVAIDSAGTAGMVVDKVLSDDVVRIVFDTFRTTRDTNAADDVNEQLAVNQVRIRLFLARRSIANPSLIVNRMIDTVVSMRAKLSKSWVDQDAGLLGSAGIDLPY